MTTLMRILGVVAAFALIGLIVSVFRSYATSWWDVVIVVLIAAAVWGAVWWAQL